MHSMSEANEVHHSCLSDCSRLMLVEAVLPVLPQSLINYVIKVQGILHGAKYTSFFFLCFYISYGFFSSKIYKLHNGLLAHEI